jgi:hypothetical protein
MRDFAFLNAFVLSVCGVLCAEAAAAEPTPSNTAPTGEQAPFDARAKCVTEHEQTQISRMHESLLSARASALSCSQAECPALLRADCVQWFGEIDKQVPSIVVSLHAGDTDVSSVTVRIDGRPIARALDGQLLELDPGQHSVKVVPLGKPALNRDVVLAAGEKGRLIVFDMSGHEVAPGPAASSPTEPPIPTARPIPTLTWVLSGTAIAAAGAGSVFGVLALSKRNSLEKAPDSGGCAPYCTDSEVAPVRHLTLTADVLFGVATVSAIGAALTYFLRPEVPVRSGSLQFDLGVAQNGASVGVRGEL